MLEPDRTAQFDDLAALYDRLVDWPRRLSREAPFFRRWFELRAVRRVVDLACGTGHHAAMFHSWGLEVTGVDVSAGMLARCRARHGEGPRLRWVQASFDQPLALNDPADAVVCLGNSLALAEDDAALRRAVRVMTMALRPGGIGVVQVLNLQALPIGPVHWQKVRRIDQDDRSAVLLKGVHRVNDRGYVSVIELTMRPAGGVDHRAHSAGFLEVSRAALESAIVESGGTVCRVLGGYDEVAFDAHQSTDLLVVWQGPAGGGCDARSVRLDRTLPSAILKGDLSVKR